MGGEAQSLGEASCVPPDGLRDGPGHPEGLTGQSWGRTAPGRELPLDSGRVCYMAV